MNQVGMVLGGTGLAEVLSIFRERRLGHVMDLVVHPAASLPIRHSVDLDEGRDENAPRCSTG
jgi:hypothetical protein